MRAIARAVAKKTVRGEPAMSTNKLPRERLQALLDRARISGSKMARELGYASPPGFLRYLQAKSQGDKPIPYEIIKKVQPFLMGAGDPPITMEELLACTDVKAVPRPVVQAFQSVVEEASGEGLLAVKYRVEPGVYIRPDSTRTYGASKLGPAKEYPPSQQFVAVSVIEFKDWPVGSQLHCVHIDGFVGRELKGKRAVIGVPEGSLMEVRFGAIVAIHDHDDVTVHTVNGDTVRGRVLGIVIGVYRRE